MICRTFSVSEVADYLGICPDSVRLMEANGVIKRIKGVPGVKYRRRDIYALTEENPNDCTPAGFHRLRNKLKLKQLEIDRLRKALEFLSNQALQLKGEDE